MAWKGFKRNKISEDNAEQITPFASSVKELRTTSELLNEAMNSDSYYAVERAVKELTDRRTPESEEALATFRAAECRNLRWERIEPLDSTGEQYEGEAFYTVRSSRVLGQQPTPQERNIENKKSEDLRLKRAFADLLNLGKTGDVAEYARRCLEDPGNRYNMFWMLRGYLEQAPANAVAAELQQQISNGDWTKMEGFLVRTGDAESIALLGLLPLSSETLWSRLLQSEPAYWHSSYSKPRAATSGLCARFPQQMAGILIDVILEFPTSSPVAVAAATSLSDCSGYPASLLQPLLSKLNGLLVDSSWSIRRDALTVLLPISHNDARVLLHDYLATETDYELQTLARRAPGSKK